MQILATNENASWQVRLHERAAMQYGCDMLAVEKQS